MSDAKGIKGVGNRILAKIEAILNGCSLVMTSSSPGSTQLGLFSAIWGAGPKSVLAWVNKGYVIITIFGLRAKLGLQTRSAPHTSPFVRALRALVCAKQHRIIGVLLRPRLCFVQFGARVARTYTPYCEAHNRSNYSKDSVCVSGTPAHTQRPRFPYRTY